MNGKNQESQQYGKFAKTIGTINAQPGIRIEKLIKEIQSSLHQHNPRPK